MGKVYQGQVALWKSTVYSGVRQSGLEGAMHFSELPVTREILGSSAKSEELAGMLKQVAPQFADACSVEGLPFTGRLLLPDCVGKRLGFVLPRASDDLGEDLMN